MTAPALLPWLQTPLQQALSRTQSHALLVQGAPGVGQFELAMALAQAWLCEGDEATVRAQGACGTCPACRLMAAHSHPDLLVLLPEALREALGWAAAEEGAAAEKASKAKPSREIKVDAVRATVAFAQSTTARGRSKVVVVFPAEQMNGIAANALLKTLEEPPGAARFVLASEAPDALLPTIRSRCQALPLGLPAPAAAVGWLEAQGVADAGVLLSAAGGQVQRVLDWQARGLDAAGWRSLPRLLAQGEPGPLAGWPLPEVLGILQRICHDAMCLAVGGPPRYSEASAFDKLPGVGPGPQVLARLDAWSRELARLMRHADHPFAAALAMEAVLSQARLALAPPRAVRERPASLHSRP